MGRLFDSKQFRTDLQLSGSFSGSFIGDGSSLTNVPATGIVGLNLSQIGSGSATASISPDNGLHVNTSISASIISGSILVTAPTGSFKHIITDDDTIEFRNKSTGIQTGRLKFDSENGLNVEDSAGGRTRIRAGFGKFLQLESFASFNSIGPLTASIISASSTIFANDIEAFRMNVTHLTSSFITASTIETSGSNIFGDESSDTHTFVGDIIAQNNISSSGYISASNFIGDGSSLTGVDSIYTANGNILETRTINDRDGGFTGTAGSNALKMNVRNSGALLVAGYQNNGDPGTTNHLIQWGPGTTAGGMNVRGKLGLTSGGGRIDLTNSGGSQYFTVAQSGITSLVSLSATNITASGNISASGFISASNYVGDGSQLTGIVTETNFTQSLFVTPSGDDSTAVVGDMMKPFASILAATGSANPGDTIIVYPGTYIEDRNLYKDGVNYHFLDGAKVVANSPVEPMWGGGSGQSNSIAASSNFSSSISITGHGEFISTSSNAMASAIFYIRVPSGVIEFKKATKHGINAGPYQCLSAFSQWSAQDSTGTLTIRGSLENSGSISSYGSVLSVSEGNINTDIVVRQHGGTGTAVQLWSATGDINGTMDVYSEGLCLYTSARTSPLSYLKGRFETLTSNQGSNYALYFGSGYRGNFHVDAEVRGAIYIGPGDIYEGSVHVRGYQEVSNSPGGGAVVIASGQNQLSQRIYGFSSNAAFKVTGGQTTFDGTVRPTGYNSKVFDISAGTFNWKGTCTGNASYPTTRTDSNVVSGGELIIESQFECFSQAANTNDEYMFNLSGGTLDIQSKLRNNVNQANNGIIDMTGGYLRMNGAELVHATQTGSFAYAIDLNGQTHSGSILNNCFTNLQPFNSGSFTNEITGGGTLFESHKLY